MLQTMIEMRDDRNNDPHHASPVAILKRCASLSLPADYTIDLALAMSTFCGNYFVFQVIIWGGCRYGHYLTK